MPSPDELLVSYAAAHNAAVRTGRIDALDALLHPTASMRFRGIDAGPFDSAAAILQAFREQPPDDELVLAGVRKVDERTAEATYAWAEARGRSAGRLRITSHGDRISSIRIDAFA